MSDDVKALIAAIASAREEQREACAKDAEERVTGTATHDEIRGVSLTARPLADRLAAAEAQVAELEERRFPVLDAGFSVPWRLVAPFEAQAERNHNQTLQRLAGRGGLDPVELWAVMHGMGWKDRSKLPSQEAAKEWALSLVSIEARAEKAEAERDEAVAALRGLLRDEWYTYEGNLEASGRASVDDLNAANAVLAKYPEGK